MKTKMELTLNAEEIDEMMDAIRETVDDQGYLDDNESDWDFLSDMEQVVYAALEAIGINIDFEPFEEEEEEEEEDEDDDFDWDKEYDEEEEEEDDDEEVYQLTPKGKFVALLLEGGINYDNALFLANEFYDKDGQPKTKCQDKPKVEEKTELGITIYNENGHRVISKADADSLIEMIRWIVNKDKRIPMKDKETAVNNAFLLYCEQELKVEGVMRE